MDCELRNELRKMTLTYFNEGNRELNADGVVWGWRECLSVAATELRAVLEQRAIREETVRAAVEKLRDNCRACAGVGGEQHDCIGGFKKVDGTCCMCELERPCLVGVDGSGEVDGTFEPTCLRCYADTIGHGQVMCCFATATHFVESVCLEAGWNPTADERRAIGEVMKAYYLPPYDYSPCKECKS